VDGLRPVILLFLAAAQLPAADWSEAARLLAQKIASITGPRQILTLTHHNRSSATGQQAADARRLLEAELRRAGLRAGKGIDATVTISENARGFVWVAQVARQGAEQVAIALVDAPQATQRERISAVVETKLLWQQAAQILDVLPLDDQHLLMLDVNRVAMAQAGASAAAQQSTELNLSQPLPRDPRGMLERTPEGFRAWLPGTLCTGSLHPLALQCRASADAWPTAAGPAAFATGRNFFEGEPAFYSAASAAGTVVLAGTDRRTHVAKQSFTGWGSDIAALDSSCGQKVIGTRAVVDEPDGIQAFELTAGQPAALSGPLALPGPVTALWTRGSAGTAVVRNLSTGLYEAHQISLACGS
jgi:hypothetical protein